LSFEIDNRFITKWHPRYDLIESDEDEYQSLVGVVASELQSTDTISQPTFRRIIDWKSSRVKGKIRWDDWPLYDRAIMDSYSAADDKKIQSIISVYGIGVPVGSTILHFMFPNDFPIIDKRTVEVLFAAKLIHFRTAIEPKNYSRFRRSIVRIRHNVPKRSLREIDRALFAFHKMELDRKSGRPISKHAYTARPGISRKIHVEGDNQMEKMTVESKVIECFKNQVGECFTTCQIKQAVLNRFPEVAEGSVIPSDLSYNLINAGILKYLRDEVAPDGVLRMGDLFRFRIFKQIRRGLFECVGIGHNYSGPIFWNEKQGASRKVGEWKSGRFCLWELPVGEADK